MYEYNIVRGLLNSLFELNYDHSNLPCREAFELPYKKWPEIMRQAGLNNNDATPNSTKIWML
jgi:hypothetical protein